MANIRPMDDRVVVEVLEAEHKSAGGIVLPDAAREKPQRGRVTAIGPGKLGENGERLPMSVKKNDLVVFGKYSGSDVEVGGKELKIMRENEILLRIEK